MAFFPKGNTIDENVDARAAGIPEMLVRLKGEGFTGYVGLIFQGAEGIFLFHDGKLVSVVFRKGAAVMSGEEAMEAISASVSSLGGNVAVYRLSNQLAVAVHGVLHGESVWRDKEIRFLDMKGLIERLKGRDFTGCFRVSAGDRTSMIFYREGKPVGFFHDGSDAIEQSVTDGQRIPGISEARIDVISTKAAERIRLRDLFETIDIRRVWGG
jgi:hypothetical protein